MEEIKDQLKSLQAEVIKETEALLEAKTKAIQEGSTGAAKEFDAKLQGMEDKYAKAFEETNKSIKEAHSEMQKLKDFKNDNKSETLQAKAEKAAKSIVEAGSVKNREYDFLDTKAAGDMTLGSFSGDASVQYHGSGIQILPRQVHLRDILSVGAMSTEIYQYEQETANDGTPIFTAEGSAVAQVDNDFTSAQAPAQKLGAYFTTSEESLNDVTWLSSFLQNRGIERVLQAEDSGILTGNGTPPNLTGLSVNATTDAADNAAYGKSASDVTKFDALQFSLIKLMGLNVTPNAILVNPIDMAAIYTASATDGQPLSPVYWVGGQPTVMGVPILMSTAVAAGTFFSGDMSASTAEILQRDGLTVRFFDQNGTNAVDGNVTIRLQERIALPIYRPTSILHGTFADVIASLSV